MAAKNIFVFRIVLEDSAPRIWRKLRVPGYFTLADFHQALQIVFGWTNSHIHSFTIGPVEYMMDSEAGQDFYDEDACSEDDYCLDDLDFREKQVFSYLYDFGDSWEHRITVSQILPFREDLAAPLCLGGKNAGPIEDSGGVWGYAEILEILKDPGHEDYQETLEWAGDVDPLAFDPEEANQLLESAFRSPRGIRAGGRKKSGGGEKSARGKKSAGKKDSLDFFPDNSKAAGSSGGEKTVKEKPLPAGKLKKLYGLMGRVKELKPWEKLWDTEQILIELPGRAEPVLCSVIGRGGESFGILVYPGFESILSFLRMADEESDNPFVVLGYQDCIICQLGRRDELFPEERERLKELGISFRGKHDWVYFRRVKPGRQPWHITGGDADLLIEVLDRFIDAYSAFAGGGLAVDFDDDEILVHRYSEKDGKWITRAGELPPIPIRINEFRVESGEVEPLRLKKQLKTTAEIEILYFPQPLGEKREGAPVLMRIGIIMNNKTGIVLDQCFVNAGEDGDRRMFDMFVNFIVNHGRPETVMVRDKFAAAAIKDLCGKIGVKLVHSEGLPQIDKFVRNLPGLLDPPAFSE
jgi:hypothetical protein